METATLTRAQRRQQARDLEPMSVHTPQGFQKITKGADKQIWDSVMLEIERQRTGAPSPVYGKIGESLSPEDLKSAKDQLNEFLKKQDDKANA